ncbi:MAG: leucyl aminopeptidase, partial [Planctomycetes bacterium]|nr:leucyl aminopeptidase [Planctomycetota bacterium]
MRTQLKDAAIAGRNDLVVLLVPIGAKPKLPTAAPAASLWKDDFGDSVGDKVLLRGAAGARWLLLRVAKRAELTDENVRCAAANARTTSEKMERAQLTLDLSMLKSSEAFTFAAVEGATMASYDAGVCKADRTKGGVKRITVSGVGEAASMKRAAKQGAIAAEGNLAARELQNLPPNILNPKEFAKRARSMARKCPAMSCKVLGEKQMADLGMGSLLGVSQGAKNEAQLVHLCYKPKGKSAGRLAFVGKGLTFDSGGISLKPGANMDQMKFDMSGGAAVFGLMSALAAGAECKYEVHGVLACVENMPGGDAQRPGDIVTAMNGKTIEILNTDAEGRLVLADALYWTATKIKPDCIYDIATLTGAAIHSLGHVATAVMGNDDKQRDAAIA